MHVLLTGANGTVGRFILEQLLAKHHKVTVLGRRPVAGFKADFQAYDLTDQDPHVPHAEALVHCALLHAPGRFRGGEGDDPETFWSANIEGTQRLFEAAKRSGCRHVVFLSSRAVYGDHRRGEILRESDRPHPDSLYGEVKLAGEQALAALCDHGFSSTALRATGIYGRPPGVMEHKWSNLFAAFRRGEVIAPRRATEVHGEDLAGAVALVLNRDNRPPFDVFNVSDLVLDRRELLALYAEATGTEGDLPEEAKDRPGLMATDKVRAIGWTPGGLDRLKAFVRD